MRTYRRTVLTPLDQEEVWDYLADFTTINEWDPRASGTRLVAGDGGVGSRYETDVAFLGRTTRMTYTVTALQAPGRIEWVGENATVRAHDVIEVTPCSAGTRVEYASSYDYRVAPAVLDRVMSVLINRLCDDAQRGLAVALRR